MGMWTQQGDVAGTRGHRNSVGPWTGTGGMGTARGQGWGKRNKEGTQQENGKGTPWGRRGARGAQWEGDGDGGGDRATPCPVVGGRGVAVPQAGERSPLHALRPLLRVPQHRRVRQVWGDSMGTSGDGGDEVTPHPQGPPRLPHPQHPHCPLMSPIPSVPYVSLNNTHVPMSTVSPKSPMLTVPLNCSHVPTSPMSSMSPLSPYLHGPMSPWPHVPNVLHVPNAFHVPSIPHAHRVPQQHPHPPRPQCSPHLRVLSAPHSLRRPPRRP